MSARDRRSATHATRLGLPHLADTITDLVTRAEHDQMGYFDLLDLLDLALGEEIGQREARRYRSALNISELPHHKTLDQFDFTFQPGPDVRKIGDLATRHLRLDQVQHRAPRPTRGR